MKIRIGGQEFEYNGEIKEVPALEVDLIRASVQHEPLFADEGGFVRGHVARDMRARPTQNEAR